MKYAPHPIGRLRASQVLSHVSFGNLRCQRAGLALSFPTMLVQGPHAPDRWGGGGGVTYFLLLESIYFPNSSRPSENTTQCTTPQSAAPRITRRVRSLPTRGDHRGGLSVFPSSAPPKKEKNYTTEAVVSLSERITSLLCLLPEQSVVVGSGW